MTYEVIPTIDGIIAITNYGPTATLFTLGMNHTVQQYDVTPGNMAMLVQTVQHVPANTPPTPPTNFDEQHNQYNEPQTTISTEAPLLPIFTDGESSADEGGAMSPLQKIAHEMDSLDALESELRDKVMPLSPTSSRASSVSSRSSGGGRRQRKYLYDKPSSSRASSNSGYDGTEFSFGGPSVRQGYDNMSIRSGSTMASTRASTRASYQRFPRNSGLRKEILRSPEESKETASMDLFPCVKARLREVAFRTPHYGNGPRTPEILQREMLSTVFGWNSDVRALIRDEMSRARPGSASSVLLAKWVGDTGADIMASMVGSESMTSSDWMLLALSSIGQDSQKKVGEAFVQRLLEKGDIHPAVAILLGLNEQNDAVEVYVSQGYLMEAVILTGLCFPADWGRQSHLLRKWGEVAVQGGQPELAVRIFSCASVESSEPWFSPRAQDAVYAAQQQRLTDPLSAGPLTSPPLSPPSATGSGRLTAKNASLKLITTFGAKGAPVGGKDGPTPLAAAGTPIVESALSPRRGESKWLGTGTKAIRDPSSARTATPGGYGRRKRLPSKSDIERAKMEAAELATPVIAAKDTHSRVPSIASSHSRRTSSVSSSVPEPTTALRPTVYDAEKQADRDRLPSPGPGVFNRHSNESRKREKKPDGLAVQIVGTKYSGDVITPGLSTTDTQATGYSTATEKTRAGALDPPLTGASLKSAKIRAIDDYISSVEEARETKRQEQLERAESRARARSRRRNESRSRAGSRTSRASSRVRDKSEVRGRDGMRYTKPAKRSPSSPVPMSPEEVAQASFKHVEIATDDDEAFYKIASPVGSNKSGGPVAGEQQRGPEANAPPDLLRPTLFNPDELPIGDRGRSESRGSGSGERSDSQPVTLLPTTTFGQRRADFDDTQSDGRRVFVRSQNSNRRPGEDLQSRRAASRNRRERSASRRPQPKSAALGMSMADASRDSLQDEKLDEFPMTLASESERRPRQLSRKELAAKELEERRLSLARRPSAPSIPMPADLTPGRPGLSARSHTDLGDSPHSFLPPLSRSQTVDPDAMMRHHKTTGTSTPSAPIGLPATPRAMRHPRYMGSDVQDAPPVPEIPDSLSSLSGSNLSRLTGSINGSTLSQAAPSSMSQLSASVVSDHYGDAEDDAVGPLLPSTVFGMKGPQAPARSASAPPEKFMGAAPVHPAYNAGLPASTRRLSGGRGHVRKISPPKAFQPEVTSIDQVFHHNDDQQIVVIPDEEPQGPPIMLPELQHLAGPPPPPPPPTMFQPSQGNGSGTIDIAIDGSTQDDNMAHDLSQAPISFPVPMDRAATTSPSMHRRGHGSVGDSFGSRMRGVADRMRSSSKSRTKPPPTLEPYQFRQPYETVLPPVPTHHHHRRESLSRAKSPYEQAMAEQQNSMPPPPPPPPAPPAPGTDLRFTETVIPPRSQSAMGGYRDPKEIRANMPPVTLQAGVYEPAQGGFL